MAKSETVVIVSANELSIGITKLSGSRPFLKVRTATPKDIQTIKIAAKKFVANNKPMNRNMLKILMDPSYREEISA